MLPASSHQPWLLGKPAGWVGKTRSNCCLGSRAEQGHASRLQHSPHNCWFDLPRPEQGEVGMVEGLGRSNKASGHRGSAVQGRDD